MSWRLRAFLGFILAVTAVQIGLGVWQWERRKEKAAFIAAHKHAGESAPVPYRRDTPLWTRVTLEGRYLHEHAAYVRTSRPAPKPGERDSRGKVPVSGFGVFVMTPFVFRDCQPDGRCPLATVYVNRGFLPTPPDGRIPPHDRGEAPVTLTGVVRPGETPGLFQPGNDPARQVWFQRSTDEMARAARLLGADGGGFDRFIDREATPDEQAPPFGAEFKILIANIPDNHLQYAITWWALAATNLAVLAVFLGARRRRESQT